MSRIEQALLRALDTEEDRRAGHLSSRPDPRLRLVSAARPAAECGIRLQPDQVRPQPDQNPYVRRSFAPSAKPQLGAPDVAFARPVGQSGFSNSVVESAFSRTRSADASAAWDQVLEQASALVRQLAPVAQPNVAGHDRVLEQASALARIAPIVQPVAPRVAPLATVAVAPPPVVVPGSSPASTGAVTSSEAVVAPGFSRASAEAGSRPKSAFVWMPVQSPTNAGNAVLSNPVATEQFRKLAGQVVRAQETHGVKVVTVTSALQGEGKSFTSSALALTLANSYKRDVLLVDADMRLPSLQTLFQLPAGWGLSELLEQTRTDQVSPYQVSPMLGVLTAGRPTKDPVGALTSARMREFVDAASAKYDFIIIDTPPVTVLPDANLLGSMVDAVLLVIAAGSTPYEFANRAVEAIKKERILGVVLNRAEHGLALKAYEYSKY